MCVTQKLMNGGNIMANAPRYTNEQQEEFIEMAKTEGISRTMRELGYPASWATANRWFVARDLEAPVVSEVQAMANVYKEAYAEKEMLTIGSQALERVTELMNADNLSPDDMKKLAESYQKIVNTMHLVSGKSTNIVENRNEVPSEIMDAISEYESKSAVITDLFA